MPKVRCEVRIPSVESVGFSCNARVGIHATCNTRTLSKRDLDCDRHAAVSSLQECSLSGYHIPSEPYSKFDRPRMEVPS